ncbi:hypothetical protein ACSAHR_04875 [Pediococcus pentosaceus]|jgi:hypothetical protein|uniref:hypothetical protein n=1 Tax=Pediococcus TaxID=1253 RepID=UPI0018A1B67F|nr:MULTISPECIES: hypothetical protein [Pediococcus]MBF7102259.1 hypothetical protein [Pediococcus pentosaceus]MBM6644268.1 hypothetical protein [Pediococcus acidilactici]MDD1389777.1 hypothetical protein [Pediococcus pentosaceus]MDE7510882.1 hypothetical protein [Pediococcus pentosaceus]UQB00016.1 hypothetical protein Ped0941_05220 [Pediococcus pentosaceus]
MKEIKVIKILSRFELIINYGKQDGAEIDETFYIMDYNTTHITDPETKEDLGSLPTKKATIKIKEMYDKFSICTNVERTLNPISTVINTFASLNVDTNEISTVSGSRNPIKIGDIVTKNTEF